MQNSSKAWLVLVGCFGFFGLALFGPALGNAGDCAVRSVVQAASDKSPDKFAKKRDYQKNDALLHARDCCSTCAMEWDFGQDRCTLTSQEATQCVATCGAKTKAKK